MKEDRLVGLNLHFFWIDECFNAEVLLNGTIGFVPY